MEEQNKTTESGQAAADLDRSLGRLDAAAQLDRLVTGLQQAAGRLDAYAASLIGSDDIIVDEAASLILHLNRKVTDRAHSMRNACENLEQSDRLLAEKAKRKSSWTTSSPSRSTERTTSMTTTSTKPEALLWIDVETTGPDRTTAQILEIGMACTDSTATQDYGAFHAIVKPDILDISRITPWAWEHHTANGLIAEVRAASTRQNGPAAVGNAAEEYLESLEQRFQLVPTGTNVDFDLGFLGLLAIDTSPLSRRKLDLTTIRRLVAILGGPDPYTSHHEGRHRVEDCITRDIHDYRHYLETIQLKDSGK